MGTSLTRGGGRRGGGGGGVLAFCLEDFDEGYVSECWERRAIDGPYCIDGIRTRLAVLENWASLSQKGKLEGRVTH